MNIPCKYCGAQIPSNSISCPSCKKTLTEAPFNISVFKIIWLSILSILLPPIGLIPGIKYMLKNDQKATMVGILMIILTFLSLAITIYFVRQALDNINAQYNNLNPAQELTIPQ